MPYRIQDLVAASPIVDPELVEIEQLGVSRKTTIAAILQRLRDDLINDADPAKGAVLLGSIQDAPGALGRQQSELNAQLVSLADYATPEQATAAAYAAGACMHLKNGQTAALVCNPTAGDDFKAMSEWAASNGHFKEGSARLYIRPTSVLHELAGATQYVDLHQGKTLDIEGEDAPDFLTITGISIAAVGGGIYTATVTTSTALPARVVVNYSIGCQNVQGDNGAESINGAHLVKTIAGDRLSFTFDYRSAGVVPTTPTTIDTTLTLGLEGSRIVVPPFCFRVTATGTGWDGAAREGFVNCFSGSRLILKNAGFSYNGAADEHDFFMAHGIGSQINLSDRVAIAGTGDKVIRLAGGAEWYGNRSYLGGGTTGAEILQGIAGSNAYIIRCCMGSVSAIGLTPTAGVGIFATQCLLTGANQGLRPTYPDASISWSNSRLSHCNVGVQATNGAVLIDATAVINKCTTPLTLAGGNIYGNPTLTANTNPVINAHQFVLGSAWYPTAANAVDPGFRKIGVFAAVLDFGNIPANSFLDLTIPAVGVAIGDFITLARNSGTEPAQGVDFRPFADATDVIKVRAFNITTAAIDPGAVTWKALAVRAT
jgi:hypothetical protein